MAMYTITRACGHTETHNITGPIKNRRARAERMEEKRCFACENAAKTEQAAAETTDLPALTGSEKQIAWATTIRAEAVKAARAAVEMAREKYDTATADMANNRAKALEGITSAKFWIDNRETNNHPHAGAMWMGVAHKHKGE